MPNGDSDGALDQALRLRDRQLTRLSRLYQTLSHVHRAILTTATRSELFQRICAVLTDEGGFPLTWVGWRESEGHRLTPVAQCGDERGYLKSITTDVDVLAARLAPWEAAARTGEHSICNDLLNDPATKPWRPELERRGLRAFAAFPLRDGDRVVGALNVYADDAGFFQDREVLLLSEAAGNISSTLANMNRAEARERAEKTIRQERDFSDAVLNSLPGVLYLYDHTGKFLRWNRNFERVTGYTPAEIAAMHPIGFFAEPDRERVANRIGEVFQKGHSEVDAEFLSKDGRLTPYHFTGVRVEIDGQACLVGVGIDVAERKRAEEARSASEGRYRTLFEQAPDGIVIADGNSFYLDANASICRMLGYTRSEMIGLHARDIVVQQELPHIAQALDVIKSRAHYHRVWLFRRKDGSTFPAEVIATVMPDGNLMGMIRDITERREAEKALRDLNESLESNVAARTAELQAALVRAEAADRIKSAFLATMSHELRTPLNSIIGFTGIVLQGLAGPLTAEQSKQLGMVRGSARHLLDLINDVLDLSKIEAEQLNVRAAPFDLLALVKRSLASMTPAAEKKGLSLTSVPPTMSGELPMVSDQRRIEQILLNLLNNAIKFTDHGGVTLAVDVVDESLRLQVTDTGIGIKPQDLTTLFQPFRQIDTGLARQHEGTGLGLAICRRLARLLGGDVSVTSTFAKGSTFTLTLPLKDTSAKRAATS